MLGYETPKSSRNMSRVGGNGLSLLQRVPSPDGKTRLIGSGAHWYAKTIICLENTTELSEPERPLTQSSVTSI